MNTAAPFRHLITVSTAHTVHLDLIYKCTLPIDQPAANTPRPGQ